MNTKVNKRASRGLNNWRNVLLDLCDKLMPPYVKGNIHNMLVQPSMLYGMETVPVISSHKKNLEVTYMKTCIWIWWPHTNIPC